MSFQVEIRITQRDEGFEGGERFTRAMKVAGPEFVDIRDAEPLFVWFYNHVEQALSECGWPRGDGTPHTASRMTPAPGALAPTVPPYPETLEQHAREVESARKEGK